MHPPVITLVGATATGKSAAALELAAELDGEIVNGDALQVYRGFDIGTAKPTAAEQVRVRHHLIDILDPHERYSAGEFARRAHAAIEEIRGRGRRPIVVGGSGLYMRALHEGLSPIPPSDPALRTQLRARLETEGLAPLRRELEALDPATAGRLAEGDTQRVLRALEVAKATGKPLSRWIAEEPFGETRLEAVRIGLTMRRSLLYSRIERRVRRMVDAGWVEEVRHLLARARPPEMPAFQAIGYRQLVRHVRGEQSLDEALSDTIRATRRFAKRQETWFRNEPDVNWVDAEDLDRGMIDIIFAIRGVRVLGRSHG